jgi:hypothetical protein
MYQRSTGNQKVSPSSFFFVWKWMGVILLCPVHRITVKVKVDTSLLIKIIVSIKVILGLVEGFSLLQNLNIKLPSTFLLRRKELKRVLYFVPALTEVYLPSVLKLQWSYMNHFPWLWWIVSNHVFQISLTEHTVFSLVSYSYRST